MFLHGGPGLGIGDGGYDMEPLAHDRVLLMYDQRGSGRSEIVSDPRLLTVDYQVRDLEEFRKACGLERMTIVGLSWGTGLAALYAAAHPERVERLLLVSPMPPAKVPFWEERTRKSIASSSHQVFPDSQRSDNFFPKRAMRRLSLSVASRLPSPLRLI